MAYTAGFSVNVGDPTKASDVTTLAANDDYLKAAVDAIMADSATPTSALKNGVTATTQSASDNSTKVATTAYADAAGVSLSGSTNNTVATVTGANALTGEANLIFDGTRLGVNNASPSTVDGNTDVVVVGDGNSNADVIMYAPTDGNGVLGWTDTANTTNQGYLHYLHDGDHLVFGTAAAERMRVNATGVGIGTASPSTLLHLRSTSVGEPILRLENANADANQAQLRFYKDGGSPADNDVLGSVEFWGEQSTNALMRYGDIYGTSTNVTNGTEDFALVFRSVEDGDLYEAMRLQGRNLGIGTTSPAKLLSLSAGTDTTTGSDPIARFERTGASQTAITVRSNDIDGLILRADSVGLGGISSYEDLAFYTGATPGSSYGTARMRIDSATGNIGIGTTPGDSAVHIYKGSAGSVAAISGAALTIEDDVASYLQFLNPADTEAGIIFGRGTDNNHAGMFYGSDEQIYFTVDNAQRMQITNTGEIKLFNASGTHTVHLDPAGDSFLKGGALSMNCDIGSRTADLTIKQTKLDVAQFNDPDVAHGMTSLTNTDTFGALANLHGTEGGIYLNGYTETTKAIGFGAWATTSDSTKSTSAVGAIYWDCGEKNGTDVHAFDSNDNLMVITNRTTARFIFDADGDGHADSAWTTFDDHDDLVMLHDIEATMIPDLFGKAMKYDAPYLEKVGIIGEGSIRQENGKTRAMINVNRLQMLHHGAIRQVHQQLQDAKESYEDKLAALEQRLLRLEA